MQGSGGAVYLGEKCGLWVDEKKWERLWEVIMGEDMWEDGRRGMGVICFGRSKCWWVDDIKEVRKGYMCNVR